jgi:hypothetical protein
MRSMILRPGCRVEGEGLLVDVGLE